MDKPVIRPRSAVEPYYFEEGCYIEESWNEPADPACSVARASVPAQGRTRWHALTGVTERYLMIAGEGVVEVGDEPPTRVGPGDIVIIPPGVRQRIINTRDDDLVFYAICTPRFTPGCYRDLGED